MTKIYISHSARHATLARSLRDFITRFGYEVSSLETLVSGEALAESISKAIFSADIVLLLYDPESKNTIFEFGYLLGLRRPTVVVADISTPLPTELRDVSCVRISEFDEASGFKILAAIGSLRDRIRGKGERPVALEYQATRLVEMNPIDFERTISNWFSSQAFQVEHTSFQGRNFDLIVSSKDDGLRYVVEFKRSPRGQLISIEDVRELLDATVATDSHEGILITTSDYTRSAVDFAQRSGNRIHLWRTDDIEEWNLRRSIAS